MVPLVISPATSNSPGSRDSQKRPLLLPDLEEIRISPIISKRGYLNVLEHKTKVMYSDIILYTLYSRVHISRNEDFSKILNKTIHVEISSLQEFSYSAI